MTNQGQKFLKFHFRYEYVLFLRAIFNVTMLSKNRILRDRFHLFSFTIDVVVIIGKGFNGNLDICTIIEAINLSFKYVSEVTTYVPIIIFDYFIIIFKCEYNF